MLSLEKMEQLNSWKAQYLRGDLTGDALSLILMEEIEQEALKLNEEISDAWLEACAQLMAHVDSARTAEMPDARDATWQSIRRIIRRTKQRRTLRVAAAAACLVLVLFGATLSTGWLRPTQQNDAYHLQGQELRLGPDTAARANQPPHLLDTRDLNAVTALLGQTPPLPSSLPKGWSLERYYVLTDGPTRDLTVHYASAQTEAKLTYIHASSDRIPALTVDFPQDAQGKTVTLSDGRQVYVTRSGTTLTAVWHTAGSYSCVAGPLSEAELLAMAEGVR